jgi:hypothetical protein
VVVSSNWTERPEELPEDGIRRSQEPSQFLDRPNRFKCASDDLTGAGLLEVVSQTGLEELSIGQDHAELIVEAMK